MSKWIANSFQLPNALVDDKYLVKLKGAALSMYILIVRKTRGWQKDCDRISLSQFAEYTGYGKDAVLTGVDRLESLGLIRRTSFENQTSLYELNDQPLPPESLLSENPLAENTTSAVGKSASALSENPTHNNKENNLNKTSAHFKEFWSAYPNKKDKKRAEQKFEKINFKKHPIELIMRSLKELCSSDDWVKENGKYIPMASTWINGERWSDVLGKEVDCVRDEKPDEPTTVLNIVKTKRTYF